MGDRGFYCRTGYPDCQSENKQFIWHPKNTTFSFISAECRPVLLIVFTGRRLGRSPWNKVVFRFFVGQLRKKIEPDPPGPDIITDPWVGYLQPE
jgi:hypothetical protein